MKGDVLGRVWHEEEVSGWKGIWTRDGNTNEFNAEFRHPSGQTIGGKLSMEVQGNSVYIHRWNPGTWGTCEYVGKFSADFKTVSGTYRCTDENSQPTPTYQWSARISK